MTVMVTRLAVTFALLLPGCGGSAPNILLVTVNTLRADRLGCHGYRRDTTPNLDALAAEGVRFERAYANAPFTAPSHASLFTSLVTQSHGVLTWGSELDPGLPSFFGEFAAHGYETGAFHNHPGLKSCALTRDASEVQARYHELGPSTVVAFAVWSEEVSEPFAAWVHLWDVHRPYGYRDGAAPYLEPGSRRAPVAFGEDRFGAGDPLVGRTEAFYNLSSERLAKEKLTGAGRRLLDADDFRWISDRYDAGVAYADENVGELIRNLEVAGLLDRTLVVVTSDHGETLDERESCLFTHDPFLYEETLRIPLIARFPDRAFAGRVVPDLVRGIDVLPTLLEYAALPLPPTLQGRSLLPLVRGESLPPAPLFAQTQTRHAKERIAHADEPILEYRQALVLGNAKLVHDLELDRYELYDLAADPGELENLARDPESAELFARMKRELESLRASLPPAKDSARDLTAEERAVLGATGYLGDDRGD